MNRVVVTGLGAVCPVGNDARTAFEALIAGRCGIGPASLSLDERFASRIAGEVRDLDIAAILGPREARRHARYTQLALIATKAALDDADWNAGHYEAQRVACVLGVGIGGFGAVEEAAFTYLARGPNRISPFAIPFLIPNMGAGMIALLADARGPCWCTSTACASGAHAIGQAMQLLRSGGADAVVCGGAEACITPLAMAGFARMGALSTRNDEPQRASRPFDIDRDGFVMAEGAAILVLELEDAALRRGARIHGCIAGFGASADAFHATRPPEDGRGAIAAMRNALADARLEARRIDYVNAHGTSTKYNDAVEAVAICSVFGKHTERLLVSSTKGATGHLLGASGAFEVVVSLLAMQRQIIPPTLNLESQDPSCELDFVPLVARSVSARAVLSNSFGFGGQNASLVVTTA
jgi:3-oxoacyl-[acyl-carrier-protein] synthase II